MPLRRSPPSTVNNKLITKHSSSIASSSSEPNVSESETDYENITHRNNKRQRLETKQDVNTDPLAAFMADMKSLFLEFKAQQNKNIEKIYDTVEQIKKQNDSIQDSINFLSEKYETLNKQITKLETENDKNLKYIQTLENRLEKCEQMSRASCVEFRNIPNFENETKEKIVNTVAKIGEILKVPTEYSEIKDTFRITTKKNPNKKTIIVEFTTNIKKENFIKMYKKYIKDKALSTVSLGINGPDTPIYISENLTAKMKRLYYLSRDFAKSNDYRYCWLSNGKIFVRKQDGSPQCLIREEADLVSLKKSM